MQSGYNGPERDGANHGLAYQKFPQRPQWTIFLLRITAQRPAPMVVDLAGVGFATSLFVGALVTFRRGIVRHGGQVRLTAMQPNIEEAFRAAKLHELFPFLPSVEADLALEMDSPS